METLVYVRSRNGTDCQKPANPASWGKPAPGRHDVYIIVSAKWICRKNQSRKRKKVGLRGSARLPPL